MSQPVFDYECFLSLADDELSAYADPFFWDFRIPVPRKSLERMLADLPTYDEQHLIFALELGSAHAPDLYAPRLPAFLRHECGSVRAAAARNLEQLPCAYLSEDLLESIRAAVDSCPKNELPIYQCFLERLEDRRFSHFGDASATPVR